MSDSTPPIAEFETTIRELKDRVQHLESLIADQARYEFANVSRRHTVFDSMSLTAEQSLYMSERDAEAAWSIILCAFHGGSMAAEAFPQLLEQFPNRTVMLRVIQSNRTKINMMDGDIKDRLLMYFLNLVKIS